MPAFQKFDAFVEALAEQVHKFGTDQIKVALCNTAPVSTNALLADLTEISYTNCSSRNVTTSSSGQTAGVEKVIFADLVLTAAGGAVGPFRYIVLYNDAPVGKNLIGFYDYGSSITLADTESLTINFDAAGAITIS